MSTYTIGQVLHASGYRWLAARRWCDTGRAVRKRRAGTVKVTDPDSEVKKNLIERAYCEGEQLVQGSQSEKRARGSCVAWLG